MTYLFISHDLSVIEYMSDEIAVMYLGKIVERFPVNNLMTTVHPYTRALIAAVPLVDPKKRGKKIPISGEVPDASNPPAGCSFHPRCNLRQTLLKGNKAGDAVRCTTEEPELRPVLDNENHVAACHWFEKSGYAIISL